MNGPDFRSGFLAIVGRPNVGKSTLLNALVGRKVAIVSERPQTTRNRILGILNRPGLQAAFLDTPGLHKPRHRLGEHMVGVARRTLREVDASLLVVAADSRIGTGDRIVAGFVGEAGRPAILVVNRADLLPGGPAGEAAAAAVEAHRRLGDYVAALAVSALYGRNLAALLGEVASRLPAGPRYYPEDVVTDQPEQFVVAEVVREKVLLLTREEVPHAVAVDVEEMERRPQDMVYVRATIYVERDSQKGIMIGQGGSMLREIGRLAREELEALLGSQMYLDLWVKVKPDWRNREASLRGLGYDGGYGRN
jgi:GTP-binding protein Era